MDLGYDSTLLVTNLTSAVVRAAVTGKGSHIECYNCIGCCRKHLSGWIRQNAAAEVNLVTAINSIHCFCCRVWISCGVS